MGEKILGGLGWMANRRFLCVAALLAGFVALATAAQAATVTLYPSANGVVGTVASPTSGYANDGTPAQIATSASSSLTLSGFNGTDLGTISDVTVWVKYKTSAAPGNDSYTFTAAVDGVSFTNTIVAAGMSNQAAYTTASLPLGALTWANVGTLAVRGATTKSGPADGYTLDFDVAYIVVTYSAPVCTPAAPTVTIGGPQTISTDNGSVNYTVNITNNDTAACTSTTFNLSRSDSNPQFTSSLPASVNLAPGANANVTLTVIEATATSGATTTTTVTAAEAGHTNGVNAVVTTYSLGFVNNPLIHNSMSTGSSKWPTIESGKAVAGWGIPNSQYGEFTCGTCHAKNTGNVKRVRTTLTAPDVADQFPVQVAAGTVNFQSTSGPNSFGDDGRAVLTQSNLICEVCHSKTAVHRYDSSTGVSDFNHKNANQTDCIACHQHKVGFKPSGCNTCHGDPPTIAGELVTGADATGSTTAGAHQTHAVTLGYACDNCHNGYVMPNGGDIDVNFSNFGSTTGTYTGQNGVSYNGAAGTGGLTCNTVYCHSTGQSANGSTATPSSYSAPAWNGTAACGSCHSNVDPATGSHTAHINDGATCVTCHAGNTHVNRVIDVGIGAYTAAGAPGNGYGTCSTANCHDNGTGTLVTTPTWGTASACAECHALQPTTGSHGAHLAASAACGDCHSGSVEGSNAGAAHRDTNVDTVVGLGYTQNKTKGSAYESCATASCHNDGRNSGLTGTWGTALNNCSECHATVPATGGHGAHVGVSFAGTAIGCGTCHAGSVEGLTAPTANHRDGFVNAAGYPVQAIGSVFTTCTTATCHQTGIAANDYVATPVWDANTANCTQCHAASPTTGSHTKHIASVNNCTTCHTNAIKDTSYADAAHGDLNIDVAVGGYAVNKVIGTAFTSCSAVTCHSDGMAASGNTPVWGGSAGCAACHLSDMTTGSHTVHLADGAACGDCHADAVKDATAPTGGVHTDGNVDVYNTAAGDLGYPNNVAYGSATWTTCNAASCHDPGRGALVVTPAWGTTSVCAECHALQPATGSHGAHLTAGALCGDCHSGAVQGSNAGTAHRDATIDTVAALGYPADKAKNTAFTTCATATCHNDGRNAGLTGTWGTALNNCSECHATVPATGGHGAHVGVSFGGVAIACADCHTGTTQGTTAGAGHRDGNVDVSAGSYPVDKALGSAFTTCTTANCHQTGISTNNYTTTTAWGTDDANCTSCHAASPTTGSHTKHIAATNNCTACHGAAALKDTSYASAQHGDLNIDVAVGGYAADKVIGTAFTSCSAVTCHSDGMAASGNTPVWGGSAGCAACHLSDMTTGSHTKHLSAGSLCGDCHADAVKDATAPTGGVHADGNVDVFNAAAGDLGYPNNVAYGSATWTTCNAASCHDPGRGALVVTPAWGVSKTDCTECHAGAAIATGSHTAHLTAGATCASCHDDAVNPATETGPAAGHLDTNIDTDLALGYTQDKAKNSAFTTCATASCHNDGRNSGLTGTWGTPLNNCSECHATVPATAAHTKHVTSQTITTAINCGSCHTGTVQGTTAPVTGHRDGNIDVTTGGYPADKALGSAYTTCTTTYCHSNGKGTIQSVNWSSTSTGCTFCHGNPPAGSHSAGDTDCSSCHNHVAAADNAFSNAALHINGTVEAQADDCTVCHGVGKSRDPESADPDHKAHTSVATMLTGKKLSTNDYGNAAWWYSVSYDATSKPLIGCGQCHPADVAVHRNGFVETKLTSAGEAGIPAINAKQNNGAAAGFSTGTGKCSAVYCHGDGINDGTYSDSPVWDAIYGNAGTTCASCHGNTPTTGTHNWHEVGIHYKTLYDDDGDGLMPSGAAPASDAGAAHGNTATADTIGCQTCHNNTVTVEHNAGNSVCGTCHTDSNAPATGNELAVIKASSTAHLDGTKTVFFANLSGFKSKSQLRNDIATVPALNGSWTRTNNYKAAAGTSFDAAKNAVPTWDAGAQTCSTVDCHNGIVTPAWNAGSNANCLACHTTLPQ